MSTYTDANSKTFVSTNDLSLKQYYIVKMDASNANQIVLASAATDVLIGVNMSIPKALDYADVRLRSTGGTIQVISGGTIAIGDAVTSNASGQGITTTTSGNQILGYALHSAVSGDIFELMPSTAKY